TERQPHDLASQTSLIRITKTSSGQLPLQGAPVISATIHPTETGEVQDEEPRRLSVPYGSDVFAACLRAAADAAWEARYLVTAVTVVGLAVFGSCRKPISNFK